MESFACGDDHRFEIAQKSVSRCQERLRQAARSLDRVLVERGGEDGRRRLVAGVVRLTENFLGSACAGGCSLFAARDQRNPSFPSFSPLGPFPHENDPTIGMLELVCPQGAAPLVGASLCPVADGMEALLSGRLAEESPLDCGGSAQVRAVCEGEEPRQGAGNAWPQFMW
jgi:hypothetical protein